MVYTSHAGITELEQRYRVAAPPRGWYVPTNDDAFIKEKGVWIPFYQGTLIPRETVQDKDEAIRRLKIRDINTEWVSYFWRPDGYTEKRFVDRIFFPSWDGDGRFGVVAGRCPSDSGYARVASLPVYEKPEHDIVMEIDEPQSINAA